MTTSWWVPPRTDEPELIDLPTTPWEDVLKGMRDVQRLNKLLLTYNVLLDTLLRHVRWPEGRPLRVLDVGTGLADIPRALVRMARQRGAAIEVVGLDLNARILEMASEHTARYPEIRLVQGDALALPFEAGHFDAALNHLALHHLPTDGHVRFFQELDRVVRPGGAVMVGDLERSHLNVALARPFLALFTSEIAQHDGIVSILKALSAEELTDVLARTGLSYLRREWLAPAAQFLVAGTKP
ncbi:MAG: SAM-dependent methyltransferase [Cyanobacteria bacterium RYN_339]|nr:SAM-dependent methyltransferase [Cyanobacteria bacterium RYN_339]